MITDFPAPLYPLKSGGAQSARAMGEIVRRKPAGAWHYRAESHRTWWMVAAAIISAGIHGAAFLCIGPTKEPGPKMITNDTPAIMITMPPLEDLDEPEHTATDLDEPIAVTAFVPMQADLPQIASPTDFVQKIDFNSLIERPDMSAAKVLAVPDNINRGAAVRQSIGAVFNLADLDRVPEPLVRAPPIFPPQLKHEITEATVRVQFIVDTNGQVLRAVVVESTHPGFNDAAVVGVSKWKFRPGIKNGRRVNTRMEVPIVFTVTDS